MRAVERDGWADRALVAAAQSGDRRALDELPAACLPLVYNIVGRALDGHQDVDDAVQETLVRVVDRLGDLHDPSAFRSWLVAIAMRQVRDRWRARRTQPVAYGAPFETSSEASFGAADPVADFVDLTILRLELSGQRRETALATRWLDLDDRELPALWWLEAAGELSRADLVGALGLKAGHVSVRVQRLKQQLETARVASCAPRTGRAWSPPRNCWPVSPWCRCPRCWRPSSPR
ncbi:RNA polymerase sigma factor [Streptomyces sp. Li-HN-5-11]|uniref:RNA polymerase sigma factor n=1 Tax=Streptomyces sp. Li-HN-5-11 TaxID=3075432 RepID=UPI0037DA05A1